MSTDPKSLAAQAPMSDHIARFWRYLAADRVRITVESGVEVDEGTGVYQTTTANITHDVAKALLAQHDALSSSACSSPQAVPGEMETTSEEVIENLSRAIMALPGDTPASVRRAIIGAHELIDRLTALLAAEKERADEGWHVARTNTDFLRTQIARADKAEARAEKADAALKKIACFDDEGANQRLEKTGSYGAFDEPCSVQIARAALGDPT